MHRVHPLGDSQSRVPLARVLAILTGGAVMLMGLRTYAAKIDYEDDDEDSPESNEPSASEDPASLAPPASPASFSIPPKSMKISPHFTYGEFWQKAKPVNKKKPKCIFPTEVPYPPEWIDDRLRPLVAILEVLRTELGNPPIMISSAYRDPKYNACESGKRDSQHLYGRAVDIKVKGHTPSKVHRTLEDLHRRGKITLGGLGKYPTFIHIDIRPRRDRTYAKWG